MREGKSWLIIVVVALIAPACDGGVHARGVVRNAASEAILNAEVRLEGKEQVFRDVSQLTVSKTGYRPFQTVVRSLSRAQLPSR